MRQLDVTDEQLQYLERVRATLETEYLGPYGQVGILDALQYLIDVHEAADPDMPSTDAAVVDAATPVVAGENRPSQVADVPAEAAVTADSASSNGTPPADTDETADTTAPEADVGSDDGEATAPASHDASDDSETTEGTGRTAERGDESEDTTDGGDEGGSSPPTPSGGNDRLQAMMNLLDTHGNKWREGDGEARYEVDLPNGSVETVQTRDDVRAVLFKNYR
ncbi:hypothetical protein [Halomarina oriensis]|uniref:Uncharacterized protein n=1 Tax=Halomarina oriensis TaxID=671145 RepID=A0A6B0GPY0_9EURY|nr:hypothetical protein [Halomarina oriensis]MWG35629.1 hypothetical protein [Halomarina oriensis]